MALPKHVEQMEHDKFVEDANGNVSVRTYLSSDIQLGQVELKDGDSATVADIESDGTKNALYVQANDLDIRPLTSAGDTVSIEGGNSTDVKITLDNETVGLAAGNNNVGNFDVFSLPVPASSNGDITVNGNTIEATITGGRPAVVAQIYGTWTGTLVFEGSVDSGSNWDLIYVYNQSTVVTSTTGNGLFQVSAAGFTNIRVRASTSIIGTATVYWSSEHSPSAFVLTGPLPSGSNIIGEVTINEVVTIKDDKASSAGTSSGISVGSDTTTVLTSNVNRKQAVLVNDSDEEIYLKYGAEAAVNSGIRLNAYGGSLIETVYTGIITGICASGSKVVTVTEM